MDCDFDLNDETTGRIFDQSQFSNTVISEWDLVCENNWVDPVLTAIFMSGLSRRNKPTIASVPSFRSSAISGLSGQKRRKTLRELR